jgi:hypothetical protein
MSSIAWWSVEPSSAMQGYELEAIEFWPFLCTLVCTQGESMPAIKVGVREFREQIARFLESDTPIAVTRRGETLGVYVPTPRKSVKAADMTELRAAADRLAAILSDVDEEEIVAEFKQMRRAKKTTSR